VIVEKTTLLEGTEKSQVIEFKHKKFAFENEKGHQPPKKAKEKYHGGDAVKMRGVCMLDRITWCTTQDEY